MTESTIKKKDISMRSKKLQISPTVLVLSKLNQRERVIDLSKLNIE